MIVCYLPRLGPKPEKVRQWYVQHDLNLKLVNHDERFDTMDSWMGWEVHRMQLPWGYDDVHSYTMAGLVWNLHIMTSISLAFSLQKWRLAYVAHGENTHLQRHLSENTFSCEILLYSLFNSPVLPTREVLIRLQHWWPRESATQWPGEHQHPLLADTCLLQDDNSSGTQELPDIPWKHFTEN